MKIRTDPLRSACEKEETPYHILERCRASVIARNSVFGSHLIKPEVLQCIRKEELQLPRESKRFSQPHFIRMYTSMSFALDSVTARPKS